MENSKMICQSCAMPMKREEDFGVNKDGTLNKEYCSFCFQEGRFTDEGITLQEKINKLIKIGVSQFGMTEEQARIMAEQKLPDLKRWRDQ